jgi:hypothetical protein
MSQKRPVALVTGANGEIGRSLIEALHRDGRYRIVTLDLSPLPEKYRPLCFETYAGNILDRYLLDQLAAHHEIEAVFHLAALLSTRGERDPELAHQINVEGTLHLLRMAQSLTLRLDRPVKFIFPSSIAAYGIPTLEQKAKYGRIREDQGLEPITMYGVNKLYAEHLGRYFMRHYRMLAANSERSVRLDFRSVRFPGLISAETVPSGGTSDYGPEMLHAAAQNPFTKIADRLGARYNANTSWDDWTLYARGGAVPEHVIAEAGGYIEKVLGRIAEAGAAGRDVAFSDFMEEGNRWNPLLRQIVGQITSHDPKDCSTLDTARYEDEGGDFPVADGFGALVARHPFGGFGMSGVGSKAGGTDYLLQFVEPRAICENTMRRGFAPEL